MKSENGKESYSLGLDLEQFERDIERANREFNSIGSTAEQQGKRIDNAFDGLGRKIAGVFAVGSLVEFEKKIISVRSEMESLKISFETLAGTQMGKQLYNDIKQFAAATPMMMGDLAKGAQTLLGFNIEAERVMPILRQIGDISMGDAQKFGSLTLAFAQMSSTGKLMGQDLLQMINAGFNPLVVIAEKTGKTVAQLKDEMSAGKISVEMVQDAFAAAAGEGGKFNGMLLQQSKGMKGAIAQMEGAIQNTLNDFGEAQQGVLVDGVRLVTSAVEHYEELGKVILTVAAAYGEWKATQMLIVAYQNVIASQTAAVEAQRVASLQAIAQQYTAELSAENADTAAVGANTAAKTANNTAIDQQVAAIGRALAAKVAEAEANLAAAKQEELLAANRLREAQNSVSYYEQQYEAALKLGDGEKIEAAENALNTAASNENAAAKAAQSAQDNVATAAKTKETAATRLSTFQTEVDTTAKTANAAATGVFAAVTRAATKAMNGLKAAVAANPFGVALVAITSIIGLLSTFTSKTEETTDALDKLRDAAMEDTSKLNTYRAVLENVDKSSKSYTENLSKLNQLAGEYNTTLFTENDNVADLRKKYDELTDAIRANSAQRLLAEAATKAENDAMAAEKGAMDELVNEASAASYKAMEETSQNIEGVWVKAYEVVDKSSTNIRNITSATWNAISSNIMSKSRVFAEAADSGQEAFDKAVGDEVKTIEGMLKSLGVTDKEIEAFHDNLYDYVSTAAVGFKEAYRELGRTKAQLDGFAAAATNAKDVTNAAIDQMNYEQLQDKLKEVKKEIDEVNKSDLDIAVKDQKLKDLRDLLMQINNLIPKQLTEGSDAALAKRLQQLKTDRDSYAYGSAEWKAKNAEIASVNKTLTSHKSSYAENATKSGNAANTAAHKAAEEKKKQQEYLSLQRELAMERKRQEHDLWAETEQAEIDAMQEGSAKSLRSIELDFANRKEELRRKYDDLRQQKFEEDKKLWETNPANKNKTFAGKVTDSKYDLTDAETKSLQQQKEAIDRQHVNELRAQSREQIQALYDYLKEYGTVQEQRYAIAKEYAEKIKEVNDSEDSADEKAWKVKALEKQRDAAMSQANTKNLAMDIDWGTAFEGVGNVLKEVAKETLDKVEEYMKTAEFKGLSAESKKTYTDLQAKLKNETGGNSTSAFNFKIWNTIAQNVRAYQESVKNLQAKTEAHTKAVDELEKAQKDLENATDDVSIAIAKKAVDIAQGKVDTTATEQTDAQDKSNKARETLTNNTNKAAQGIKNFSDYLDEMSNGSLYGFANGITKLVTSLGKGADGVGKSLNELGGKIGGIVGAILQIIDALGDDPKQFLEDLLTQVADTVEKIIEDLPEIVLMIIKEIGDILQSVVTGIASWFGADDIFGLKGNEAKVAEVTERLTKANEVLADRISDLTDVIGDSAGAKAIGAYEAALEAQEELQENNMEVLRAQMGYYSAHHSNAYYASDAEIKRLYNASKGVLGKAGYDLGNITGLEDIYGLTPDELKAIKDFAPDLWKYLTEVGKYDKSEYWESVVEQAGKTDELTEKINDNLTQTSFDSLRDSFLDALTDMESSSEDFAQSFEDMMFKAVLNSLVLNDEFDDWLKGWQERYAEAVKSNDTAALKQLRQEAVNERDKKVKERDDLAKTMGYSSQSSSQDSTTKGFATASQDSIDELNGRFSALVMIGEETKNIIQLSQEDIATLRQLETQHVNIAGEIRNLGVLMVSHLEDISRYTKHLISIDENVEYFKSKIN